MMILPYLLLSLCLHLSISASFFSSAETLKYYRALGHYSWLFIFSFSVTSSCPIASVFLVCLCLWFKNLSLDQIAPLSGLFYTYTYQCISISPPTPTLWAGLAIALHMFPLCYPTLARNTTVFPLNCYKSNMFFYSLWSLVMQYPYRNHSDFLKYI